MIVKGGLLGPRRVKGGLLGPRRVKGGLLGLVLEDVRFGEV